MTRPVSWQIERRERRVELRMIDGGEVSERHIIDIDTARVFARRLVDVINEIQKNEIEIKGCITE